MGADEEATLRTLQEYKEVMASSIQHHRGRIVGTDIARRESALRESDWNLRIEETRRHPGRTWLISKKQSG